MRFVLYTNVISPHQLPLAREIAKSIGEENFRYIYTQGNDEDHKALGWSCEVPNWCILVESDEAKGWLENADILLSGLRDFDLFNRRADKGLKNFYMTERWLKPPIEILRLLLPKYFGYARRLCKMLSEGKVVGLPIGMPAARDMARLCGLMHGDLRCLFSSLELKFEKKPGGRIAVAERGSGREIAVGDSGSGRESGRTPTAKTKKYCLDKMRMWGYFVEKGERVTGNGGWNGNLVRVLWVGRLLGLKRVDTIIRAVGELSRSRLTTNGSRLTTTLDIYGTGPEERRLRKIAAEYGDAIKFYPPVPISDVRKLMREHDVYVLASNGYEGWGAVVSEALEEEMKVVGTYEAGASATLLPEGCLFRAGDWRRLMELLSGDIPRIGIGDWTAARAAEEL